MSSDEGKAERNYIDELKKNEEARKNAPVVDSVAAIWINPTTRDVEFEFVDKEGVVESSLDATWRKYGFVRGKITVSGNILYLTLIDGTTRYINVSPRTFDHDYESSLKDRLKLLALEWMRRQENNPELSLKFAERDPSFELTYKGMLENGKSFLVRNLKPLQVVIESGKRGAYNNNNARARKHKRLTVNVDDTPNKPKDWTEHDHPLLLQNLGSKKVKSKTDVKLVTNYVTPAQARRVTDRGAPIGIVGIVETSADDPVQRIVGAIWRCHACGQEIHQHTWSYLEKPKEPSECPGCFESRSFEENHIVLNTMLVKVQPDLVATTSEEALTGRISVLLMGDEQTKLNPVGLKMVIRGHLDRMPLKNGGYEPVVIAHRVLYEEKRLHITERDELAIKRFVGLEPLGYTTLYSNPIKWLEGDGRFTNAPDVYLNRGDVLDRLVSLVAPFHVLDYNQRLTAPVVATGAPEWEGHRGRVPALFIGPPGTDKTSYGEWILKLRPTSRKADATNMTGLSATAMVLPDENGNFNIHFGPFVMARHGICMIDEYEKIDTKERNRLLSGTEHGYIWLDKYIHHRKIAAPTTLLATANPRDNKWEDPEAKHISSEEIPIELQQLNRFDIILTFKDVRNIQSDRAYGIEKGIREIREKRWGKRGDQQIVDFIAKYIEYVRNKFPHIHITPAADEMITEYWSQARQKESSILQKRNLQAIKRIAEAIARLSFCDVVDETIAPKAIKFHNETIEPFLNAIIEVHPPRDELFSQLVSYVRNKKGNPVMVKEATRTIIERDRRLADYINGADKNKNWPLEQGKNPRYDELCTAIKEHPHIEVLRHKSKTVKLHAFTVRWNVNKYAEDEKLRKAKEERGEESSSTIQQSPGTQNTPPLPKTEVSTPIVSVVDSEGTTHNASQLLEQSHETRGVQNVQLGEGGQISVPGDSGILLEEASEVVVKTDYSTPMAMLHGSAISVDLEWNQAKDNQIYQAAFKDHTGKRWVINLKDKEFNRSEPALIRKIIATMKNYRMVLGYFSQGNPESPSWKSDWEVLHDRCKRFGIDPPVKIYESQQQDPDDELRRYIHLELEGNHGFDIIDVDIGALYKKQIVKNFFATKNIVYNSHELDIVAKTILGRGKPVLGVSGANVSEQSLEIQKAYGIADAELCYDLATAKKDVVIAVMDEIANIVKLPFQTVCNSGPSKWWTSYYENVMHIKPAKTRIIPPKPVKGKKKAYKGGKILPYKRGEYSNVTVHDFRQLYPNTAIKENLAPDVLFAGDDKEGCGHLECREDPRSLIVTIDRNINKKGYWRCMKQKGCYPQAAKQLTALRARYEDLAAQARRDEDEKKATEYDLRSTATKIFSNSGYGVFGNHFFPYADLKTAECITALARTRLHKLTELATSKEFGYQVLYGDTDSVFLLGETTPEKIKKFEQRCEQQLGIPARYEKTFTRLLLISAKNYMGEYVDKEGKKDFMVRGLVGKKSNTAAWVRKIFDRVKQRWISDEKETMLEPVVSAVQAWKNGVATSDLESDLHITVTLRQDPFKGYKGKGQQKLPQKILGMKYHKKEGESVSFYLADPDKSEYGAAFTEIYDNLSLEKYLGRLETAVLKVLHTAGFEIEDIYDALGLKVPPPGQLRNKLWGKKVKEAEEDTDDEDEEEFEDAEI